MSAKPGKIVGRVVYAAGDGAELVIPIGPCEIEATSQDVTISWRDGDANGVASIPVDQYTIYTTGGAIALS